MITLRCCICDLELGQADAFVRITCPSCQQFKRYLLDWLDDETQIYDNDGFDNVEWMDAVEKLGRASNNIILAFSNAGGYYLDTQALNDVQKWSELCLLQASEQD